MVSGPKLMTYQISAYIFSTFLDRQPEMDYPGQEEAEAPAPPSQPTATAAAAPTVRGSLRNKQALMGPSSDMNSSSTTTTTTLAPTSRVMGRVTTHQAGGSRVALEFRTQVSHA